MAHNEYASVEELQRLLTDEADGYRQLVELTRREHAALQQENLAELAATVQGKQSLLPQLKQWESIREQLVARLSGEFNLPTTATLSDLIERLDGAIARNLAALRQEFVVMMEQLLRLNQTNHLMLQAGLVRVDATFDYLASLAAPPDGYYTARGIGHTPATTGNVLNWEA